MIAELLAILLMIVCIAVICFLWWRPKFLLDRNKGMTEHERYCEVEKWREDQEKKHSAHNSE